MNFDSSFYKTGPDIDLWTSYPGEVGFNAYTGAGKAIRWQALQCNATTTKNLPAVSTLNFNLTLSQLLHLDLRLSSRLYREHGTRDCYPLTDEA